MSEFKKAASIHPRVQGGTTVHQKVNTCGVKKKTTIERSIRGVEGHLEQNPTDMMARKRLASLIERL